MEFRLKKKIIFISSYTICYVYFYSFGILYHVSKAYMLSKINLLFTASINTSYRSIKILYIHFGGSKICNLPQFFHFCSQNFDLLHYLQHQEIRAQNSKIFISFDNFDLAREGPWWA